MSTATQAEDVCVDCLAIASVVVCWCGCVVLFSRLFLERTDLWALTIGGSIRLKQLSRVFPSVIIDIFAFPLFSFHFLEFLGETFVTLFFFYLPFLAAFTFLPFLPTLPGRAGWCECFVLAEEADDEEDEEESAQHSGHMQVKW